MIKHHPALKKSLCGCLLFAISFLSNAQEDVWWFDVEVILFDRGAGLKQVKETFTENQNFSIAQADWDLITTTIEPDVSWLLQGLQSCVPSAQPTEEDWVYKIPEIELPIIPPVESIDNYSAIMPDEPTLGSSNEVVNNLAQSTELRRSEEFAGEDAELLPTENEPVILLDPNLVWLEAFAPEFLTSVESASSYPRLPALEYPPTVCSASNSAFQNTAVHPFIEQLPVVVNGASRDETWGPHVISASDHSLTDLSLRIRQERKLTRLLHATFRQPVLFGRDQAYSIRLFGGKNFAKTFDASGKQIPQVAEFVQQLETTPVRPLTLEPELELANEATPNPAFVLKQDIQYAFENADKVLTQEIINRMPGNLESTTDITLLEDIWQIEGSLKVYLQNVSGVPYLHIDSALNYRQAVPLEGSIDGEMRLASVPFSQLRRVISTQLHYFDHPMFGMLIEIRRYRKP